jgi:hypothetical protein
MYELFTKKKKNLMFRERNGNSSIWVCKDPNTRELNGEVEITFEDLAGAEAAVAMSGVEFQGNVLEIRLAPERIGLRPAPRQRDNLAADGDWACPKCSFNNFARRGECFKCHEPNPNGGGGGGGGYNSYRGGGDRGGARGDRRAPEVRPGDWMCSCGANNFARRDSCFKCGKRGGGGGGGGGYGGGSSYRRDDYRRDDFRRDDYRRDEYRRDDRRDDGYGRERRDSRDRDDRRDYRDRRDDDRGRGDRGRDDRRSDRDDRRHRPY